MCSKVYVITTLLFAVAWALSVPASNDLLILLFLVAISVLGIPHGALDALLANSFNHTNNALGLVGFFMAYLAFTIFCIAVWLQMPEVALVVFLAVSIYHFSQDWRQLLPVYARLQIATIILCGPTLLYADEVVAIFTMLGAENSVALIIAQAMQTTCVIAIASLVIQIKHYRQLFQGWKTSETTVLLCSAVLLPPLLHFTLYFCLLHSFKHLLDIIQNGLTSRKHLLLFGIPTIAVTYIGMFLGYLFLKPISIEAGVLQVVFVGLFGLTMSHMIVIHFWHKRLGV